MLYSTSLLYWTVINPDFISNFEVEHHFFNIVYDYYEFITVTFLQKKMTQLFGFSVVTSVHRREIQTGIAIDDRPLERKTTA